MTATAFPLARGCARRPVITVGAGCGIPRVTGLDTQVNAWTGSYPCRVHVAFVTLW